MWMFIAALFTVIKLWNQPSCSLVSDDNDTGTSVPWNKYYCAVALRPAWQREGCQADYSFYLDSRGGGGKWLRCCDSSWVPEEQCE